MYTTIVMKCIGDDAHDIPTSKYILGRQIRYCVQAANNIFTF